MNISNYFFTCSQTAEILNTTRQTISRWVKTGKFKTQRVGRECLIPKQEVEQFLNERLKQAEETCKSITETLDNFKGQGA